MSLLLPLQVLLEVVLMLEVLLSRLLSRSEYDGANKQCSCRMWSCTAHPFDVREICCCDSKHRKLRTLQPVHRRLRVRAFN